MTTFALVHGSWGSGWHWGEVPDRLRELGHAVVAPDLPCEDPSAAFSDYADVVVDALAGAGGDVVVVGFSLGGCTIPLVAARRPVRELVYVAALLPLPGRTLASQFRGDRLVHPEFEMGVAGPDEQGRTRWIDFDVYYATAYDQSCDRRIVRERFDRTRAQSTTPYREPCPLDALADVPSRYVMCADDRLMHNAFWRGAARERLGVDPIVLSGGHSPMVARADELVQLFVH